MSKGEFEWPPYVENGEDGVEVLGNDGELLAVCIRPDIARRVADCLDGCRKIEDPEKTIPKLVELQKLVLDLPPIIKDVLVAAKMPNMSECIDNLDTLAQEALEGVSNE